MKLVKNSKIILLQLCVFLFLLFVPLLPNTVFGNSAEPPSIYLIVLNKPEQVQIDIFDMEGNSIDFSSNTVAWETHYALYWAKQPFNIVANTGYETQEIVIDPSNYDTYTTILTLNLNNMSVVEGKSLIRSVYLISIRLFLTLLLEGLIFYWYGFREKRSWIYFVMVNVATQGFLNVWLNGANPYGNIAGVGIYSLFLAEILIVAVESYLYLFLKEHTNKRRLSYAVVSNCMSFVLGMILISNLPF